MRKKKLFLKAMRSNVAEPYDLEKALVLVRITVSGFSADFYPLVHKIKY
jgi:hypothetical protein